MLQFSFLFFRFTQEPPARPPRGGAGDAIQGTGPVAKSSMYRDEYQPLAASKVRKKMGVKGFCALRIHRPLSANFADLYLAPADAHHTARAE